MFTDNPGNCWLVDDENKAIIEELKEKIINGELVVPGTEEAV